MLIATKIQGIKIKHATIIGNRFNQQNSTSWSYLNLGKVAINQTNTKQNIQVFIPSTTACMLTKLSLTNNSGIL